MSTIAAGTSAGTALVSAGNTDGTLQLQVNGTTPSVTLAANGSIGVGSTPAYGTNGQVLTSAGTGSAPTWTTLATPPASSFAFVSGVTATAASAALLNTGFTSTYDVYELVISATTSNNNAAVRLRYEIAGSVVTSATYFYNTGAASEGYASGGYFEYAGTAAPASLIALGNVGNGSSQSFNLTMRIYRPSSTTVTKQVVWAGTTNRLQMTFLHGSAINSATGALTGLELTPDGGTISCTMRLYGIANS